MSAAFPQQQNNAGHFAGIMSKQPTQDASGFTTWDNQGSATADDCISGIKLGITSGNGSSHVLRTLTKAAPSAPYTLTFLFLLNQPQNFNSLFVGWNDGTKFDGFLFQQDNAFHSQWTNHGSQSTQTNLSFVRNASNSAFIWVQLKRDNSNNVTCNISFDGETWIPVSGLNAQAASGGFLGSSGYSNVCWGIDNYSSLGSVLLASYADTNPLTGL